MKNKYNLEERTALFVEDIICLCKDVQSNHINKRIISQLVASSGSIGANYCEVCEAESKKDFIHKIRICNKEIRETKHWFRLLAKSNPGVKQDIRKLWKEGHELHLIFSKTVVSSLKNSANVIRKTN